MREFFHRKLERSAIGFVLAIIGVSAIGGFVEIAPLFTIDETVEKAPDMRVYTPLELAGRNIYIREGCYACHSQMIRTLRDEVERYGPYSLAVESKYDHPMLWGSKRTGPDIARLGGKYSDAWHVAHLINPRDVVPQSVMPKYGWLMRNELKTGDLGRHLKAQRAVGVPYTDAMIARTKPMAERSSLRWKSSGIGHSPGTATAAGTSASRRSASGTDRTVIQML